MIDFPDREPSEATVEAVGKLSEALEVVERARGHLYSFHQLTGTADLGLSDAADLLERAGHPDWAERIRRDLIGLNVLPERWTFQIVEEYDDGYYRTFTDLERDVRDALTQGRRHLFEQQLKERRRTHGQAGHEPGAPTTSPPR
ncbi:hypothetical protein [Amycolatopsis sp. 195334CR]|uniref:hypothetical protein n=1 Tax=Amycolatopsis sp. 195334CR TaxID=2814588 RepID=UPI001A8ED77E|nr:hypothetical protein [Amycolatopsis sp. 195334CR]MBN6038410.1 hypothetical protein [Amycolatopsis sp. 195334CR]